MEQLHAVVLFELAHLVGDRRLAEEQPLGGAGETAVHRHRMEGLELGVGDRHRGSLLLDK
ncbi:hypothetical protein D3C75_1057490 [compost metagenome]